MKGKLFIIEAGDGSGKATQAEKLTSRLTAEGFRAMKVSFPNYQSQSSALIRMYLKGEFGSSPEDVNPYVASTFYAVDRYASFRQEWEAFYRGGGIVVADRYTTSNMVHQAAKIPCAAERDRFLHWLWDLEFEKFQLPVPDAVIFLHMPPQVAFDLLLKRDNATTGREARDIHEEHREFLKASYENACRLASAYGWLTVECCRQGELRPVQDIHGEIYSLVRKLIEPGEDEHALS